MHVDSEGKIETLNVELGESSLQISGTLAGIFDSQDGIGETFIESNRDLWKIEPNSASYFEIDDELLTESFFEVISKGVSMPEKLAEEKLDSNWVDALPDEEFSAFKWLCENYDVEYTPRALIINASIYGIFYNSGQTILIQMSPYSEFTTPDFETSLASFSYICWGSRTSGWDSFYLIQHSTGHYYIFGNLDDRGDEFFWLPEGLNLTRALFEFINFLHSSANVFNLSRAGMIAAIYDSINGANEKHFLEAHSELSEHDPCAPAAHYYGVEEFEIDLYMNVPNEIVIEILNAKLLTLPEEISRKITAGEYCYKTSRWADSVTFTESEWSLIRKYDSFVPRTVEEAFHEFEAASAAINNRNESVANAQALLGIEKNDLTYLLTQTNECIKNDSSRESAYWEAYWVLRDEPSIARLQEAEVQKNLAEEIQLAAEKLNWPKNWNSKFAPAWLSLGGDALTVERWFKKGWTIHQVLFEEHLPAEWNGTITQRVGNLDAPDVVDSDD